MNRRCRSGPAWTLALWMVAAATAAAQAPRVTQREPEFDEARVETDVMIPMRDGVRLAADVYRPGKDGHPAPGRFPTLLTRTPYNKGRGDSAEAKYYAARGYVVVMNDCRGRYASEGAWRLI